MTFPRRNLGAGFFCRPPRRREASMADFDLIRSLAQSAQTKIVLLVMDGLGGLPVSGTGSPPVPDRATSASSGTTR
jgi:hypothetical protein